MMGVDIKRLRGFTIAIAMLMAVSPVAAFGSPTESGRGSHNVIVPTTGGLPGRNYNKTRRSMTTDPASEWRVLKSADPWNRCRLRSLHCNVVTMIEYRLWWCSYFCVIP